MSQSEQQPIAKGFVVMSDDANGDPQVLNWRGQVLLDLETAKWFVGHLAQGGERLGVCSAPEIRSAHLTVGPPLAA